MKPIDIEELILDRIDKYQLAKQSALTFDDDVEVGLHEAVLDELYHLCSELAIDTIRK